MSGLICTVQTCDQPRYVRGWCSAHYQRWRKYGSPTGRARSRKQSHCDKGHPLKGSNLRLYRRKNGYVDRNCVACNLAYSRKHQAKLRAVGRKVSASKTYFRQYRIDVKSGVRQVNHRKAYRRIQPLVVDLLQIEGSWWSVPEIADRLKAQPDSVGKALSRLAVKGVVTSRRIVQAKGRRFEWKITT